MPRRHWSFWMSPLEHSFIRALDDRARSWFTPLGQALMVATLGSGFLLLGGIAPLLVKAAAFCGSLLVAALVSGLPFRRKLRLTRRLPGSMADGGALPSFPAAGDDWSYDVLVENPSSRPVRDVWIQERRLPFEVRPAGDPPCIPVIEPGQTVRVRLTLHCALRGEYRLERLEAATSFPSGLLKLDTGSQRAERVLVYPRFDRLETFEVPVGRTHQPGGVPVASKLGDSTEFSGLRDWREGDRPRDVHWPSYARSGRLVVREFQEEYFARLALVVDVESRNAKDDLIFEKALSLAAAIADALARQEYLIDLFVAGTEVHHLLAGRALAHFENVLELLACTESGDTIDAAALEAALIPAASRLSAVVFVLTGWSASRAALVAKVRSLGVAVRVVCARPGTDMPELTPDEKVEVAR